MPYEITALLFRKSIGALADGVNRCSRCRRSLLAGELIHELETHHLVCELCLARLPEEKRTTVGSQRVPAADRQLVVAQRAA